MKILLDHAAADSEFLKSRLADGRTVLHLAAIRGNVEIARLIIDKRQQLFEEAESKEKGDSEEDEDDQDNQEEITVSGILDIDGADWQVKLNALQYAIEKQMKKKDAILNKIEFLPDGRVVQCRLYLENATQKKNQQLC